MIFSRFFPALLLCIAAAVPTLAQAATTGGAAPRMPWGMPFAGMLLSIALLPLCMPAIWHRHHGKIAAAWALAFLLPFAATHGMAAAGTLLVHALLAEYLPFLMLLSTLYVVAGGICLNLRPGSTAARNTAMLALGAALASVMGTTGAAMLLVRPLLRANAGRRDARHVMVFLIFVVANVGGALTPLGDPPLFLGFLNGVGFLWTARHLSMPMLSLCIALLAVFYAIDRRMWRREAPLLERPVEAGAPDAPRLDGVLNVGLLLLVVAVVLLSGVWRTPPAFTLAGTPLRVSDLLRDATLVLVLVLSLWLTPASARRGNAFEWGPIVEVAKLFAGIFVTIAPVLAMLAAGSEGPFAALISGLSDADGRPDPARYFWLAGGMSAFLDNAPTYLVFFHMAGGDAAQLMGEGASTLAAISAGAVFMGALTYIGNAPNFMVKAIAEARGVRMPSFFGYMVWSGAILVPLLAAVSYLFFSASA